MRVVLHQQKQFNTTITISKKLQNGSWKYYYQIVAQIILTDLYLCECIFCLPTQYITTVSVDVDSNRKKIIIFFYFTGLLPV